MDSRIRTYQIAADYIRQKIGGISPVVGIVLGSGLGRLADQIENPVVIPYRDIPRWATRATTFWATWVARKSWPCRVVSIITKDIRWNW